MAKPDPRKKNGHKRRQAVARLRARHDDCALCHQPIDYTLPAGHPYSFECDEKKPVSKGGSPYDMRNLQATHRICNQRKGNGDNAKGIGPKPDMTPANDLTLPLSREW